MTCRSPTLGMCFPRDLPPALVGEFAARLDTGGIDQLWIIEDCFFTGGVALAATALARSERLTVGLGILPAVARAPAVTAMEVATLASLGPGRVVAGIGHGVQSWMAQMGVRPDSPLTALEEVVTVVRRLLSGDTVTFDGRYVRLAGVALDRPPDPVPPVLAGVRGPRSLALAGRVADGLVLAELSGPTAVRAAIRRAAATGPFPVVVYSALGIDSDRAAVRRDTAPWLCEMVAAPSTGLRAAPFFDDLAALVDRHGAAGVERMPEDWWTELAAVGDPDDVCAHIEALGASGATTVAFHPPPFVDEARIQRDRLLEDVVGRRP